jgi:hypothetical protein
MNIVADPDLDLGSSAFFTHGSGISIILSPDPQPMIILRA